MKLFRYLIASILLLSVFSYKPNEQTAKVKDYLSIPGPIDFNKVKFNLSWSAHPNATYYKQEYIPLNETSEKYTKMIMVEAVAGDFVLLDVVKNKMDELQNRKKTDAVANYQVVENKKTGEFLLDFVMSAASANNETIVEWNAYRYRKIVDKTGKKGIALFAYSRRAYGAATTAFLKSLQKDRVTDNQVIASYTLPSISLSNN